MSAEQLVEDIITQALETAAAKAELATEYSETAIKAADARPPSMYTATIFGPPVEEPRVDIPRTATGVDGALYGATYAQIVTDLSGKFAAFFADYFPNERDSLAMAQEQLHEILSGGTGVPTHVEDQIWQRDRARALTDVGRVQQEIIAGSAARGFPLPTGAALYAAQSAQIEAQNKVAQQSRDVAIKHIDILLENIKFAIGSALDYRIKAIQAAGDYIKTIALGPDIAMKLATSAAGAQAQLISAASQYYRNRVAVAEMQTNALIASNSVRAELKMTELREFSAQLRAKTDTLSQAARAAGDQAAAALNAVHASAQVAVQGEAA